MVERVSRLAIVKQKIPQELAGLIQRLVGLVFDNKTQADWSKSLSLLIL